MGSLCSGTPNWPGQDFFKTVLKFAVLPTQASFLPSLLSQVSTLPPGWKPHPIYSSFLPLYISKVFPPINFLHIEFCPRVCFLEEGTHKKERGPLFFFPPLLLASEMLREMTWMPVDFSSISRECSSASSIQPPGLLQYHEGTGSRFPAQGQWKWFPKQQQCFSNFHSKYYNQEFWVILLFFLLSHL